MLLIVVVLAAASVQAHAVSLVTNGSFELGSYSGPSTFATLSAGSTAITGWTVEPNGVDWINTYWAAQNGTRSLDLSGNLPGGVSQQLTTTLGSTYHASFWLNGNVDGLPRDKATLVTVAVGAYSHVFTWVRPATPLARWADGWTEFSFDFTATGPTSTLAFMSQTTDPLPGWPNGSPWGPALDNVSVVQSTEFSGLPTPELSTWALLACTGLCGVGTLRRRRRA